LVEEASDNGVQIRTASDFEVPSVFILRFAAQEAKYKVIWPKRYPVGAELVCPAVSEPQLRRGIP